MAAMSTNEQTSVVSETSLAAMADDTTHFAYHRRARKRKHSHQPRCITKAGIMRITVGNHA